MPALEPTGLMVDLLKAPQNTEIHTDRPKFSWTVNSSEHNAMQQGFQIAVASTAELLLSGNADVWDSGKPSVGTSWSTDSRSTAVEYGGPPLKPDSEYCWRVRTWLGVDDVSPWSEPQCFRIGSINQATAHYQPVVSVIEPGRFVTLEENRVFADFGKAAFGTVRLTVDSPEPAEVQIHLGEVCKTPFEIDRNPGGARRYQAIPLTLSSGRHTYQVEIPADDRNTNDFAVKMPDTLFEVYPFRYCEITGSPVPIARSSIEQLAVHYPFDERSSSFKSSSRILNDVWNLCKYTMKATSFCGLYVDGDRERIPYEADAYINQIGHYGCDNEYTIGRRSIEYLITTPTWPTEWHLYLVLAAWNDYMFTGDTGLISRWFDDLRQKTLMELARPDGLITLDNITADVLEKIHFAGRSANFFKDGVRDIVDWPQVERDGHEMLPVNSVVNALHHRALVCLAEMAKVIDRPDAAAEADARAAKVKEAFCERLIHRQSGLVVDGEGSGHSSLHSNLFALACGLVDRPDSVPILDFIRSRGMACSVYASQMLLEALYQVGDGDYALSLLTGVGERSWAHMIYDVGSTIALEAWDNRLKPNQDWNHAWGAAPAGMIPFGLMGIWPLEPGFSKVLINPQPGRLGWADITTPTVRGPVSVRFTNGMGGEANRRFVLECDIPANMTARIGVPSVSADATGIVVDGKTVYGERDGSRFFIDGVGSGSHTIIA